MIVEKAVDAPEETAWKRVKISLYTFAVLWLGAGRSLAAPLGASPEAWGKAAAGGDIRIFLVSILLLPAILLLLILPGGVFRLLSRRGTTEAAAAPPEEPVKKWAVVALYAAVVSAVAAGLIWGGLAGIFPGLMGAGGGKGAMPFYLVAAFCIAVAELLFLFPCGVSWLLLRNSWFRTSIAASVLILWICIAPISWIIPFAPIIYGSMSDQVSPSKKVVSGTVKVKTLAPPLPAASTSLNLAGFANQPPASGPVDLLVPGPRSVPDGFKKAYQSFFAGEAVTFYLRPLLLEKKAAGPAQIASRIEFQEGKALYESERVRLCRSPYRPSGEFIFNKVRGVVCASDDRAHPELVNYNLIYNDGGRALVIRYVSVPRAEFAAARIPDVLATLQRQ